MVKSKQIDEFPMYKIYDDGRVYSHHRNIFMKQSIGEQGYPQILLQDKGYIKTIKVHRLVATHFVLNPKNKPEINHINGVKTDNGFKNLEWCTRSENILHSYRILNRVHHSTGKFGVNNAKHTKVDQYDLEGNHIKTWSSIIDVERELGFFSSGIIGVCKGRKNKCGGFIWKYN